MALDDPGGGMLEAHMQDGSVPSASARVVVKCDHAHCSGDDTRINRVMPEEVSKAQRREIKKSASSNGTNGPPRLQLHLLHHFKVMMLLNILPLIGGLYLWWNWRAGRVTMRSMSGESQSILIVVIVSGLAFAVIAWFIMPIARWLRDYPTWHLRHGPAWAWIIPTCGGWAAWIILNTAGILAAGLALLISAVGIWNLFAKAG